MKVNDLKQAVEDAKRFVAEAERVLAQDAEEKAKGWHKFHAEEGLIGSTTSKTTGIIKAQSLVLSQSLVRIRK